MILKSEFFYCHTYEFDFSSDVAEGWGGGGGGHTMYGGLPHLCVPLTSITGKDFANVSLVMACLQVICAHLDVFRVV